MHHILKALVLYFLTGGAFAQNYFLSPNGYSGIGIMPSAESLPSGLSVLSFEPVNPGALLNKGYNTQLGFGLYSGLEFTARLATNNLKCNIFKDGDCPPNSLRDFSASMKWALPIEWFSKQNAAMAIGLTDYGGAATYFRSYYVVGSKTFDKIDLSLGVADAKAPSAMLNGVFGGVSYRPTEWAQLSLQKVGPNTWAHAVVQTPITQDGTNAWLTFNRRINENLLTPKNWVGWGVSIPLDRAEKRINSTPSPSAASKNRSVVSISDQNLQDELEKKGFFGAKVGVRQNGTHVYVLENTSYPWSPIDAAGVALGVIAGLDASGQDGVVQKFELVITARGVAQLQVTGEAKCLKKWLENSDTCSSLSIRSLTQAGNTSEDKDASSDLTGISWRKSAWSFRPEIVISPTLVSTIGTEYGAFDMDGGVNINTILPLWQGAVLESNRIKPLGVTTQNFEQGYPLYASRLKPATNRTMFHQVLSFPLINTQTRLSMGTSYSVWEGSQIETTTQSNNGRHKFGMIKGEFKNDTTWLNNTKDFQLYTYRYAHNDRHETMTELTQGKFWGGDKGFNVSQRFWHGDTSLNLYLRRTRMTETAPLVSFAGVQISFPFTPRENKGTQYLSIRGTNQWTYTVESKVMEKDNIITYGYGEVPKMGENLQQIFNRDRSSTRYYESMMGRMRSAYVNLARD